MGSVVPTFVFFTFLCLGYRLLANSMPTPSPFLAHFLQPTSSRVDNPWHTSCTCKYHATDLGILIACRSWHSSCICRNHTNNCRIVLSLTYRELIQVYNLDRYFIILARISYRYLYVLSMSLCIMHISLDRLVYSYLSLV